MASYVLTSNRIPLLHLIKQSLVLIARDLLNSLSSAIRLIDNHETLNNVIKKYIYTD